MCAGLALKPTEAQRQNKMAALAKDCGVCVCERVSLCVCEWVYLLAVYF